MLSIFINLKFLSILSYPFFENRGKLSICVYPSPHIYRWIQFLKPNLEEMQKVSIVPSQNKCIRAAKTRFNEGIVLGSYLSVRYLLKAFFNLSGEHFWGSTIFQRRFSTTYQKGNFRKN